MLGIDASPQANAAWMEHEILDHVKDALRVTISWRVPSVGIGRKRSSVMFTLGSFRRHLERLMQLEERDGYMGQIADAKPHLFDQVKELVAEHQEFRNRMQRLVPALEAAGSAETGEFQRVCEEIQDLLDRVDEHDEHEVCLLQEAFLSDEGGEG